MKSLEEALGLLHESQIKDWARCRALCSDGIVHVRAGTDKNGDPVRESHDPCTKCGGTGIQPEIQQLQERLRDALGRIEQLEKQCASLKIQLSCTEIG